MADKTSVELFAWIGEDEMGSGEIGLKQAMVPAGVIPMVAVALDKMNRAEFIAGFQQQARIYGKTIRLCRFVYAEELIAIEPGDDQP
jgi:hypothetical protein